MDTERFELKQMTLIAEETRSIQTNGVRRRGNRTTRVPAILAVSMRVFAVEGNMGFTQRRVASEAGVRLSTLQHYFGNRESLLHSTIEEMANQNLKRYRLLANDDSRSAEARLDEILDETFAALDARENVVSPFSFECWCLAEHQSSVRELLVEINREFQDLFGSLVAQINAELTPEACRVRGALLFSHWQGLIVFLRRSGRNAPEASAFRADTTAMWKALSKAPP
ncbi:bacterial regulatory s, tetR family protein [Paraburkholderia xenovorans LB400]|uniref:Transcriptional regulator, TetR family n=1 Tax=Paraburkholderia xenovorans (strain LB400) TaxID=266265 RepID=Q13GF5_PARXL|nr:TetR/AcrR family transcriptional regulator [Paraburkholderia xenovorans]ABE36834.1 transcriptional regulator, TetR family [Paraburkholderia xenovorans LB400]AIP35062.1 bacterial regulatory s, tetR family protein [Paraburkholderia xenovorans LB400]